jgi:hypothetical protein
MELIELIFGVQAVSSQHRSFIITNFFSYCNINHMFSTETGSSGEYQVNYKCRGIFGFSHFLGPKYPYTTTNRILSGSLS